MSQTNFQNSPINNRTRNKAFFNTTTSSLASINFKLEEKSPTHVKQSTLFMTGRKMQKQEKSFVIPDIGHNTSYKGAAFSLATHGVTKRMGYHRSNNPSNLSQSMTSIRQRPTT